MNNTSQSSIFGIMTVASIIVAIYVFSYVAFRFYHGDSERPNRTVVYYNSTAQRYLFYGFIPMITIDKTVTGRISEIEIARFFEHWTNDNR